MTRESSNFGRSMLDKETWARPWWTLAMRSPPSTSPLVGTLRKPITAVSSSDYFERSARTLFGLPHRAQCGALFRTWLIALKNNSMPCSVIEIIRSTSTWSSQPVCFRNRVMRTEMLELNNPEELFPGRHLPSTRCFKVDTLHKSINVPMGQYFLMRKATFCLFANQFPCAWRAQHYSSRFDLDLPWRTSTPTHRRQLTWNRQSCQGLSYLSTSDVSTTCNNHRQLPQQQAKRNYIRNFPFNLILDYSNFLHHHLTYNLNLQWMISRLWIPQLQINHQTQLLTVDFSVDLTLQPTKRHSALSRDCIATWVIQQRPNFTSCWPRGKATRSFWQPIKLSGANIAHRRHHQPKFLKVRSTKAPSSTIVCKLTLCGWRCDQRLMLPTESEPILSR